jgi:probable rRNA maturation factor
VSESELLVEVSVGEDLVSPVDPARIEAAVRHVLRGRGIPRAELSVALLADVEMASLNQQYLGHEGTTDAITFALHEEGDPPLGDIYIGVEQAVRQAAEFGATPAEEVLRLAVHGALHVLGFEHPEGAERVDSEMFRLQEALLAEFLGPDG